MHTGTGASKHKKISFHAARTGQVLQQAATTLRSLILGPGCTSPAHIPHIPPPACLPLRSLSLVRINVVDEELMATITSNLAPHLAELRITGRCEDTMYVRTVRMQNMVQ